MATSTTQRRPCPSLPLPTADPPHTGALTLASWPGTLKPLKDLLAGGCASLDAKDQMLRVLAGATGPALAAMAADTEVLATLRQWLTVRRAVALEEGVREGGHTGRPPLAARCMGRSSTGGCSGASSARGPQGSCGSCCNRPIMCGRPAGLHRVCAGDGC